MSTDGPAWPIRGEPPDLPAKREGRRGTPRRFGLVLAAGFAAMAGVLLWHGVVPLAAVAALPSAVLLASALLEPERLARFRVHWESLEKILALGTNRLLLTIVYLLLVTPLGRLSRWTGWNPFDSGRGGGEDDTFWEETERTSDADRYLRPF